MSFKVTSKEILDQTHAMATDKGVTISKQDTGTVINSYQETVSDNVLKACESMKTADPKTKITVPLGSSLGTIQISRAGEIAGRTMEIKGEKREIPAIGNHNRISLRATKALKVAGKFAAAPSKGGKAKKKIS